jgi:uncharacterized spore protein YtfJ
MTQITEDNRVLDTLRQAVEGASAGRVFGEPVAQDGVILLPVAKVAGGGGGGGGTGPTHNGSPETSGSGGGFGTSAKGLGVFALKEGKVSWHPAIDVNRVVLGGQIVAVVALLVARSVLGDRRRPTAAHFPSSLFRSGRKAGRKTRMRAAAKALRAQVKATKLPALPGARP